MKNIVITSACGRIGRVATRAFCAQGYSVFALELKACEGGENIIPVEVDIRSEESDERAAEAIAA